MEVPVDLADVVGEETLTKWVAEYPDFPIVLRPMTEEEFVAWCDEDTRAEFKDGEVIVFSPSSWKHSQIVRFLVSLLTLYVEKHGLGMVAGQAFQVRLRPGLRREPDVLFISKGQTESIRETWVEGAPSLVVEVVSPDSLERDWREKYYEYRDAGVKEYWVIDPYAKAMAVYQLEEGQYKRIKPEKGVYRSKAVPGFWLKPEWLWQEPLPKVLDAAREMEIV